MGAEISKHVSALFFSTNFIEQSNAPSGGRMKEAHPDLFQDSDNG